MRFNEAVGQNKNYGRTTTKLAGTKTPPHKQKVIEEGGIEMDSAHCTRSGGIEIMDSMRSVYTVQAKVVACTIMTCACAIMMRAELITRLKK